MGPALTPDEVSVADVAARLTTPGFYVFDLNGEDRWRQSHVPGAKPLKMPFDRNVLPDDPSATLVFYCLDDGCMTSHAGAARALKLGFKNVCVMGDGIAGWEAAGLPIETTPTCRKIRGELVYTPDPAREGYWYVRDPFWGRYLSFNDVQVEMMRALDGTRAPREIRTLLGDEFGIEISIEKIESFLQRLARELLLDDVETERAVEKILEKDELSVFEVHSRLGEPGLHIFDLNGEARWKQSHLPGAKLLSPYHFERHELPEDPQAKLVFYCTHDG